MSTTRTKRIRAVLGFTNVKDADVVTRATAVLSGMTGNANYPTPPIDIASFKTAIDALVAAIALAQDGGKRDIAVKNAAREAVIKMFRQLGTYVEANCKEDMAIFTSSGLQPTLNLKSAAQPLAIPVVKKIDQGIAGQLLVRITGITKAKSYELRYGVVANGTTATWTSVPVASVKKAIPVAGLTPGTTYAFQVRALGALGMTDWSDSAIRMCI